MASVVPYRPEYRADFERLNRAWIEQYFVVEEADREVFADPEAAIVRQGGEIFFVVDGSEVLGTCAIMPHEPGVFEIAKMAVSPSARGRGYGDLLMEATVEFARRAGATKVVIVSNTVLTPAIRLYEKHGFVRVPLDHERFARANIRLERPLGG
ncbi:MAG TPA: GNAT family N-acetyltransferase [Gemmatimonadales bacterium]|jgi:ribosomal protein S18 acetylase RimI-like enzyme